MATSHDLLPYRRYPCAQCPWRRDTPPGQFAADRYDALAATSGVPGREAPLGAPLFACHKSPDGAEEACAGWLAAAGDEHLGIRLAIATGRLPATVLHPGDDWPDLFASHDEMATTQARPARRPPETTASDHRKLPCTATPPNE